MRNASQQLMLRYCFEVVFPSLNMKVNGLAGVTLTTGFMRRNIAYLHMVRVVGNCDLIALYICSLGHLPHQLSSEPGRAHINSVDNRAL